MKNLIVSAGVLAKLREKHSVTEREVGQCFENKLGLYLIDDREDHQTDPPTLWFISTTNDGRTLKVIFIFIDGNIHIKSAFEPHESEIALYDHLGR